MNEALEQLLRTRAILNSCQGKLAWNANIGRCQNEDQAAKATKEVEVWHVATIKNAETHYEVTLKEAETCHVTQAHDLEESHKESVLKLECKVLVEEGHDCQTLWRPAVQPCGFVPLKLIGH